MLKSIVLTTMMVVCCFDSFAQSRGYSFQQGKQLVEVPAHLVNNLPVIEVTINKTKKLNFILDTGIRTTIVFGKKYLRGLSYKFGREIQFAGIGNAKLLKGRVINNMQTQIGDFLQGDGISMVVLEENHKLKKEFEKLHIHGVIGYELFARFVVEIDYHNQMVSILKHDYFDFSDVYTPIKIEIQGTKPYLKANVKIDNQNYNSICLMLDTGSGTTLILDKSMRNNFIPEAAVAKGLSGEVLGMQAKLDEISFNHIKMQNVPIYFIDNSRFEINNALDNRMGTIGGGFFSAYSIAFDYANSKIYLKRTHPSSAKRVIVNL